MCFITLRALHGRVRQSVQVIIQAPAARGASTALGNPVHAAPKACDQWNARICNALGFILARVLQDASPPRKSNFASDNFSVLLTDRCSTYAQDITLRIHRCVPAAISLIAQHSH